MKNSNCVIHGYVSVLSCSAFLRDGDNYVQDYTVS
jgi:hypothetical protein